MKIGRIGPNGAGKNNPFNMIAGDLEPSGGKISYFGEKINRCQITNELSLELSEPSKKNNFMLGLTVKENLLLVLQRMRNEHIQWWKRVIRKIILPYLIEQKKF